MDEEGSVSSRPEHPRYDAALAIKDVPRGRRDNVSYCVSGSGRGTCPGCPYQSCSAHSLRSPTRFRPSGRGCRLPADGAADADGSEPERGGRGRAVCLLPVSRAPAHLLADGAGVRSRAGSVTRSPRRPRPPKTCSCVATTEMLGRSRQSVSSEAA